jgi:hypothetical protein
MPIEAEDIESEGITPYRVTGLDPLEFPGTVKLAKCYPGIVGVVQCRMWYSAELVPLDAKQSLIKLRDNLSLVALFWNAAHELQEHRWRRKRFPWLDVNREQAINSMAAATIAPRVAVEAAYRAWGPDLPPRRPSWRSAWARRSTSLSPCSAWTRSGAAPASRRSGGGRTCCPAIPSW